MIKVSVLYPNNDGVTFNFDYYCSAHMDMVKSLLGDALKGASVDAGLGGGAPGEKPTYIAMGHLLFDSVEAFQQAFGPHAGTIAGDGPNYTNVAPVIQISDVKI